jgi:hypothetical protein
MASNNKEPATTHKASGKSKGRMITPAKDKTTMAQVII